MVMPWTLLHARDFLGCGIPMYFTGEIHMILTILGDWVSVVQSVVIDKADVVRLFEARSARHGPELHLQRRVGKYFSDPRTYAARDVKDAMSSLVYSRDSRALL